MEKKIVTKCGYRCDLCLAYKPNAQKRDQRQFLSDGWYKLYGFRIPPQDIICEGCVSKDNPLLIDKNCPVRPCVISKELENCAYCNEYICDTLKQRIVNKADIKSKLNHTVSDEEYENFIKPYESKERLDKIRELLQQ